MGECATGRCGGTPCTTPVASRHGTVGVDATDDQRDDHRNRDDEFHHPMALIAFAEGVIKSVDAFTGVVSANDMTLYPGTYELKHQMKASQAAQILSDQGNAKGFVEVRQGERLQAVLERASEASGIELKDFEAVTTNAEEASKILPAEANGNFEGWLEPGVYNVSADPSATQICGSPVPGNPRQPRNPQGCCAAIV